MLTIENQSDDIEKKNIAASQLNAEKIQLVNKVESLQASLRTLEAQVFDLKEDKARIEELLKSGDDSARVLDEYKKRAQMALKKVRPVLLIFRYFVYLSASLTGSSTNLMILMRHMARC